MAQDFCSDSRRPANQTAGLSTSLTFNHRWASSYVGNTVILVYIFNLPRTFNYFDTKKPDNVRRHRAFPGDSLIF